MISEKVSADNLIEKISRWIDQNRTQIGRKILCIGTGEGPALHLAHLFPDASIVLLTQDPSTAQAEAADSLRGPLRIHAGAADYDGGLFDTVLSLDDVPLNAGLQEEPSAWERGTLYLRRASILMETFEARAQVLCRHLRPGGTLLSLVRADQDEFLLGYCFALAAEGLQVSPAIRQILCRENGQRQILQGITAGAGARTDIGALVAENLNFSLDRMNTAAEELQGREAEILLQADCAELVRGYHIYRGDTLMGKLAVYTSMSRPDVIYYFTDVSGDSPYLRRFHIQDQQKVLRHMVGQLHRQKASDKTVSWRGLRLEDSWAETEEH